MGVTPSRTRHVQRVLLIWFVCTVLGLLALFLLGPHLADWGILPPVASDRAGDVDSVLFLFTLLAIPVFMFVVVFGIYSARAFRSEGRPTDGVLPVVHPRFSPIWLVVSILLVTFLYVFGLYFLNTVQASAGPSALEVQVNGEQWLWNYTYPQYNNVGSTELELPVGHPVNFTITSTDVQHSFWIPAFGIKQDAVPGEVTHISVTPSVIGDYVVRCAELCGLYHAYMETPVHVVSQADFDAWVAKQQPSAPSGTSLRAPTIASLTGALVGVRRYDTGASEG
jgi:cytochrome c oxidase subunit II